jgi:hypothetical protein
LSTVQVRDFSLEARRSSRVALRRAVRVHLQHQDGTQDIVEGHTTVVSRHGARIETAKVVAVGDAVTGVSVVGTGTLGQGKIVWVGNRPNDQGRFEVGLEIDPPSNLWGVHFPPDDWGLKSPRRSQAWPRIAPAENA